MLSHSFYDHIESLDLSVLSVYSVIHEYKFQFCLLLLRILCHPTEVSRTAPILLLPLTVRAPIASCLRSIIFTTTDSDILFTMNSDTNSEPKQPSHNLSYLFPDADLVLVSSDGVLFRVHSLVLKLASQFFRDMFTIPRDVKESESQEPIPMAEREPVLEALLGLIYPNATGDIAFKLSYEEFCELIVIVTQKYNFDAGQALARGLLNDPRLPFSPILRFGIA